MSWPAPVVSSQTRPFWDYARQRELRVQRCQACGHLRLPPGPVCPQCFSRPTEWVKVSGDGVLQGWVTYRRQYEQAFPVPYTVGLIELDEGPRLEGLVRNPDELALRWRMRVELAWRERDGFLLPEFEPVWADTGHDGVTGAPRRALKQ